MFQFGHLSKIEYDMISRFSIFFLGLLFITDLVGQDAGDVIGLDLSGRWSSMRIYNYSDDAALKQRNEVSMLYDSWSYGEVISGDDTVTLNYNINLVLDLLFIEIEGVFYQFPLREVKEIHKPSS